MMERTNEAAALKEIWLLDSTGREWVSDASDEITDDAEGSLRENLQEIGNLKHLNLTIDGNQIHFNPAHVVAFTIRAHPNPEPPTGDGEREGVGRRG